MRVRLTGRQVVQEQSHRFGVGCIEDAAQSRGRAVIRLYQFDPCGLPFVQNTAIHSRQIVGVSFHYDLPIGATK